MKREYGEIVGSKYKDQLVDVYLGDSNGVRFYAEEENAKLSFIRGTIVDYEGDAIIMECKIRREDQLHTYEVILNGYNIKCVMVVQSEYHGISKLLIDNRSMRYME